MTRRSLETALAGCAALAVAMGIGRFAFTPILPMMQGEGTLDVAQGGWLASANYVGYLVGGLSAMRLAMRPRAAIRTGLAAVGLSTLAMGLTHAMVAWLVLRAIAGVASAWVLVFASAWCLEQFQSVSPARAARLGAALFSGVGTGIALAGIACVAFLVARVPAADAWIALGLLSLAVAALTWNRLGDAAAAGVPAAPGDASAWNTRTVLLAACYGAFGFGYIIPATFLSAMARDTFPDPAVYGWSWPIFGAAAAASTFAAAWRGGISPRALWVAGHLTMAAGVTIPLAVPGIAGIAASALLVGGTFMVVTMAGMQEARRIAGARAARRLIAAMTSSFALGQIAGPLAVSLLAARGHGFAPALALAGTALVASALALAIPFPTTTTRTS